MNQIRTCFCFYSAGALMANPCKPDSMARRSELSQTELHLISKRKEDIMHIEGKRILT